MKKYKKTSIPTTLIEINTQKQQHYQQKTMHPTSPSTPKRPALSISILNAPKKSNKMVTRRFNLRPIKLNYERPQSYTINLDDFIQTVAIQQLERRNQVDRNFLQMIQPKEPSTSKTIVIDHDDEEEETTSAKVSLMAYFGHMIPNEKIESEDCSICCSSTIKETRFKTTCGHVFDIECLFEWIIKQEKYSCPNCREDFSCVKETKLFKKLLSEWENK